MITSKRHRWSLSPIGRQQVTWSGQVRGGRSDQTSGRRSQLGRSSATACRWVGRPWLGGQQSGSDCSNPSGPSRDWTCMLPWQPWPSHPLHLVNRRVRDIILASRLWNQKLEALQVEVSTSKIGTIFPEGRKLVKKQMNETKTKESKHHWDP